MDHNCGSMCGRPSDVRPCRPMKELSCGRCAMRTPGRWGGGLERGRRWPSLAAHYHFEMHLRRASTSHKCSMGIGILKCPQCNGKPSLKFPPRSVWCPPLWCTAVSRPWWIASHGRSGRVLLSAGQAQAGVAPGVGGDSDRADAAKDVSPDLQPTRPVLVVVPLRSRAGA